MSLGAETKGAAEAAPHHAALSSGGAGASARVAGSARLTPKWAAPEVWGRSTILRAVRRQAISSRLSAFTASSASSRQRPVKGKTVKAGRLVSCNFKDRPTFPVRTQIEG